jgi:hypothetical protein
MELFSKIWKGGIVIRVIRFYSTFRLHDKLWNLQRTCLGNDRSINARHGGREKSGPELSVKATLKYRLAFAEEALGNRKVALKHAEEAVHWVERLEIRPDVAEAKKLVKRLQGKK